MRLRSHNVEFDPLPIGTKIILSTNIVLYIMEVIMYPTFEIDLVSHYCLSPAQIINEFKTSSYTINGISSLFLSNLFHLNPWTSGPMGVLHIAMNMMTLLTIGKFLERKMGSFAFLSVTMFFLCAVGPLQIPIAMFLEFITMNYIPLLSTNQCGVGYSAVLFAYFILYLRLMPTDTTKFCGFTVKKWVVPFMQLLLLSIVLHASFIGHLSGIVMGFIYISGMPGCFRVRQNMLMNMEKTVCNNISNRADYVLVPTQPNIDQFKPSVCCLSKQSDDIGEDVSDTSDESHNMESEIDGLMQE